MTKGLSDVASGYKLSQGLLVAARGKSCAQGMQYLGGQKLKYEVMGCQMWPVVSSCDWDSGF